jgi:Response regulator receiver domain.
MFILDINMPEMDGYQVLSALQVDVSLRAILVIALTAMP